MGHKDFYLDCNLFNALYKKTPRKLFKFKFCSAILR